MLQDTICMVVIHHRMVKDTKYCDIMGWLLSCYEPKGRGFESLLARHVGAKSALLRRLFLPSAQKAAGCVAPLLLLPAKSHAAPPLFACKRAHNAPACYQLFADKGKGVIFLSALRFAFIVGFHFPPHPQKSSMALGARLDFFVFQNST